MSKLTGCIKTGANVHFSEYGITIEADVFRIGNCILIRTKTNQLNYDQGTDARIDLVIHNNGGREQFWREDVGVFAVPEEEINFNIEI